MNAVATSYPVSCFLFPGCRLRREKKKKGANKRNRGINTAVRVCDRCDFVRSFFFCLVANRVKDVSMGGVHLAYGNRVV